MSLVSPLIHIIELSHQEGALGAKALSSLGEEVHLVLGRTLEVGFSPLPLDFPCQTESLLTTSVALHIY
jgi:hypothetical protein